MALITPPTLNIRTIKWSLMTGSQINVSVMGVRTFSNTPMYGKFSASVELAPIQGEANFRALRSFLLRCKGAVNYFKIIAVENAQNSNTGVTTSGVTAKGATSVTLSGASTPLEAGQMMTINDQLLIVESRAGSVYTFQPPLRAQASAGSAVETKLPYALVSMVNSQSLWEINPGRVHSVRFEVTEAYS